jgi:hypothetical protein
MNRLGAINKAWRVHHPTGHARSAPRIFDTVFDSKLSELLRVLSIYVSAVAPRTSQILSMPRGSCCDEACKRLFLNLFTPLPGLHSQKR